MCVIQSYLITYVGHQSIPCTECAINTHAGLRFGCLAKSASSWVQLFQLTKQIATNPSDVRAFISRKVQTLFEQLPYAVQTLKQSTYGFSSPCKFNKLHKLRFPLPCTVWLKMTALTNRCFHNFYIPVLIVNQRTLHYDSNWLGIRFRGFSWVISFLRSIIPSD